MISTCFSLIQDIDSARFAAVVVNYAHQTIASADEGFSLDGKSIDPSSRYKDIWDFMERQLSDPDTTQVIIAVPTLLEIRRVESIPVVALAPDSIYLKVLHYLYERKYCALLALTSEKARGVVQITPSCAKIEEVTKQSDYLAICQQRILEAGITAFVLAPLHLTGWRGEEGSVDPPPHKLMIIHPTIANAYARFLFETLVNFNEGLHPSWAALAAAFIAETDGLYYYFASEGVVQSSQDIVEHFKEARKLIKASRGDDIFQTGFLSSHPGYESSVVSAEEVYRLVMSPSIRVDKIDQIPLKYAVAMNTYQKLSHVSEQDSQKFALLTICKLWRIGLLCNRIQFEYLFRGHQASLVYPSPSNDREFSSI